MTNKESARELYEHRDDPDEWDDEAIEVVQRPARSAVVSLRFPLEEYRALRAAATAAGESASAYIREAVKQRQEGMPGAMIQGISPDPHVRIVFVPSGRAVVSLAQNEGLRPKRSTSEPWSVTSKGSAA